MSDPVLMKKGTLLRVTVGVDGAVRTSIDHNVLHEVDLKDVIFLLGCMRQLEHKILTLYNERVNDGDVDE